MKLLTLSIEVKLEDTKKPRRDSRGFGSKDYNEINPVTGEFKLVINVDDPQHEVLQFKYYEEVEELLSKIEDKIQEVFFQRTPPASEDQEEETTSIEYILGKPKIGKRFCAITGNENYDCDTDKCPDCPQSENSDTTRPPKAVPTTTSKTTENPELISGWYCSQHKTEEECIAAWRAGQHISDYKN
jgi:hypothetical protein